jgi:hypothetical protein
MNKETKFEPWKWYPHLFPTEAKFWTWLRGGLRRGLWEKSPIKLDFKNKSCSKPPEDYTGRAKSGQYCYLTGEWEGKSKLEVDHIEGNVSLTSVEDILKFVLHLIPPPDNMALVKKEAHKIKSYAERMGITFEEAVAEKKAIQLQKQKTDRKWLEHRGVIPESNATKRRKQIVEWLLNEEKVDDD